MAAAAAAADVADDSMSSPFRYFILLETPGMERAFWRSEVYRAWLKRVDTWSVCFMLVNNGFFFIVYTVMPHGFNSAWAAVCIGWYAIAIGQHYWMKHYSNSYQKWRTHVVYLHRFIRLVLMVALIANTRSQVGKDSIPRWSERTSRFLPPSLAAVRNLSMVSLAVPCLMHGYAVPLPFIPQLLLHLIYLIMLVVYYLPAAVAFLDLQGEVSAFENTCHGMNILSTALLGGAAGDSLMLTLGQQLCEHNAKPALIVFLMAWLGTMLPIYVAFRVERHAKELFWCSLQVQGAAQHVLDPDEAEDHCRDPATQPKMMDQQCSAGKGAGQGARQGASDADHNEVSQQQRQQQQQHQLAEYLVASAWPSSSAVIRDLFMLSCVAMMLWIVIVCLIEVILAAGHPLPPH